VYSNEVYCDKFKRNFLFSIICYQKSFYNSKIKCAELDMNNNVLILAEDDLGQLPELNLQMYPHVIVATSSQSGTLSIASAKALLAIQLQHQSHVQLLVNAAKNPNPQIYWACLLGKLAASAQETQITLLTSDHAFQALVEICAEYGQSLRLLRVNTATQDLSAKKPVKSTELPTITVASLLVDAVDEPVNEYPKTTHTEFVIEAKAPPLENAPIPMEVEVADIAETETSQHEQTIQVEQPQLLSTTPAATTETNLLATDIGFTDIHAIEPTEKTSEIAEMIKEKEERKRKNEQIINALMKKVSAVPYKIVETKTVAGTLEEQVINPLEINKSWWVNA
jgi:hypothetical protein